jgi:hypothetical protein
MEYSQLCEAFDLYDVAQVTVGFPQELELVMTFKKNVLVQVVLNTREERIELSTPQLEVLVDAFHMIFESHLTTSASLPGERA